MSQAVTISGSQFTVVGTVKDQLTKKGVQDLHVLVYDKDRLRDDFLGIGITDSEGEFSVEFNASAFNFFLDRHPELYFIVKDAGTVLLNTEKQFIKSADESTPAINLEVDMSHDKLRPLIKKTPAPGWVGGFLRDHPELDYPPQNPNDKDITPPDLTSLAVNFNRQNIDQLDRQQKVLWPEFSWNSEPDNEGDKKRCYQMFAPDISRLGYTKEGKIYSVICPQQGICVPHLGCMNVEVTVTGSRGWVDEKNRTIAGDMSVVGTIWFSPSGVLNNKLVKLLMKHFVEHGLPFPSSKEHAIIIKTHKPGDPNQALFPLTKGLTPKAVFDIPDFAKHGDIPWSSGHLGVQIGAVTKLKAEKPADEGKDFDKVNKFNQFIVDIFNMGAGNMLKEGNILTWNVWFNAPEKIDKAKWTHHTEKWRESIDADHGSPEGEGTSARYFDGTPFKPLQKKLRKAVKKYMKRHLLDLHKNYFR